MKVDFKDSANKSGIYLIKNLVNSKVYVGRTKNFSRRYKQYLYDIREERGDSVNSYLLNSIKKYGADNFEFSVFKVCDNSLTVDEEYNTILLFDSTNPNKGYNLRNDKVGVGMITHELTSQKISDRLKKEWQQGTRRHHSEKMTKYWFVVYDEDGYEATTLTLKELKESPFSRCLSRIGQKGVSKVSLGNGAYVEKVPIEEFKK